MKVVFKTMDIWQWRTMISQRQEMNELSPMTMSAYSPKRFPGHNTRWGNWVRVWQTHWIKEMELTFRADQDGGSSQDRVLKMKRAVREEILGICRVLFVLNRTVNSAHVWENYLPRAPGQNRPKEAEGQVFRAYKELGIAQVPIHRSGYSHINEMICAIKWRNLSRGILCYTGI